MKSRLHKRRRCRYVFQVYFLSSEEQDKSIVISRQPTPFFVGTMNEWYIFVNSKKGVEQLVDWQESVAEGYYEEILISQFVITKNGLVSPESKTIKRFLKNPSLETN